MDHEVLRSAPLLMFKDDGQSAVRLGVHHVTKNSVCIERELSTKDQARQLSVNAFYLLFDRVILTSFSRKIPLDRAGQHGRAKLYAAASVVKA